MTFSYETKNPILPWEGHKRIALHEQSAKLAGGSTRMNGAYGIMSVQTRRNIPDGQSILLARARMENESGIITVEMVPDQKKTGRFDSIEEAWFSMLESAMQYMTPTEAEITSRFLSCARPAYAAAHDIILREDVSIASNRWLQTIANLPGGMSLRRMVFPSTKTSNATNPALHGPDNAIMARIETNDDGSYVVWPSRKSRHTLKIPQIRFTDANEALLALATAGRTCGSSISGHEMLDYMDALQAPLSEQGPFAQRFGLQPLCDPISSLAAS